jgi:hypothetical protein
MFLPPLPPEVHSQPITQYQTDVPASGKTRAHKKSNKFWITLTFWRLSAYGFFFCSGIAVAHIARALAGILYPAFVAIVGGYLLLGKPEDATEEMLSLRRISSLALVLSVIAWWDWVLQIISLPIPLFGFAVLPVWKCILLVSLLGLAAFGYAVFSAQPRR